MNFGEVQKFCSNSRLSHNYTANLYFYLGAPSIRCVGIYYLVADNPQIANGHGMLQVNPGSKAALRGVREGDLISSINGQSTKDLSNTEAHALLKRSGNTLHLGLNE